MALLRGINVGGHRKVPMRELREALTDAGFSQVRTYIQSGNVIFQRAPARSPDPAASVAQVVTATFGFEVVVMCRSGTELTRILDDHPFRDGDHDLAKLHVAFLDAEPDPGRVELLDPDRSPGDRFAWRGRELYLHYPEGSGRSKLTGDYLERTLQRRVTARNVNTIGKLLDLVYA